MTVYRITGLPLVWVEPGERTTVERRTVTRSQKGDLAYYEDLQHAKRGLIGLSSHNMSYKEFRIEELNGEWVAPGY